MGFPRAWLEPRILAMLLTLASAAWLFVEIADEVADGDTGGFDRALMLALHPQADGVAATGPAWMQAVARDTRSSTSWRSQCCSRSSSG